MQRSWARKTLGVSMGLEKAGVWGVVYGVRGLVGEDFTRKNSQEAGTRTHDFEGSYSGCGHCRSLLKGFRQGNVIFRDVCVCVFG